MAIGSRSVGCVGGFFGAWLGGLTVVNTGAYTWMWWANTALSMAAALVNLPIKEARVVRQGAMA
ncbi:hypothetical protein [Acidovorax sp.]|uniref:hypothetical protein n=1 Tax=Acidovorax sp. TaxID=1872122 RepID=UPI003D02E29F